MPIKDERTKAAGRGGKHATSGRMSVMFVNAKRLTMSARVLGAGSSSGLKLMVGDGPARRIVDNVPKATTRTSVNCYLSRI